MKTRKPQTGVERRLSEIERQLGELWRLIHQAASTPPHLGAMQCREIEKAHWRLPVYGPNEVTGAMKYAHITEI